MDYLDTLNSEQKKAVLATDGPVLIIAGAGAGKTKTVTHRILHLILSKGVDPREILAITFTNKSANEMKERVINLLKDHPNYSFGEIKPFVSTFHSLGVRILKDNAPLLNLPRFFSIYDKADSKKAVKEACLYIGLEPKENVEKIQAIISAEKSRGHSVSDYTEREAYDYTSEMVKKVWPRYEEILKKEGALDFDDLLLKTLRLFKKFPEVLERYQNKFKYVHVDEYQDTNKVQNEIVELIVSKHGNICVVGDADQCIYSWRGAEIKNMIHFEKKFPSVQTFFLEQNYRSTKNILSVANEIIEKNKYRIPKKLFTENIDGEKISLFEGRNEADEAFFIAMKAKDIIERGELSEEIAVLYRANFQSRILEEAFIGVGVPYQMLGTKFFERKEIKDLVSYIRLALNPSNGGDLARVINVPARGLGKVTVEKILDGQEESLAPSARAKLTSFREMIAGFREILEREKFSHAVKQIIEKTGIKEMYDTEKEEDVERLQNIMELVSLATEYDNLEPTEAVENFLTDASLVSDQDSLKEGSSGVKLMTVHSAKGLEFDYVFIAGLEDGLFPHSGMGKSKKTNEDSEEERRLFYVAVTRARKKLWLSWANTRTIFGNTQVNAESEFLSDIPENLLKKESYGSFVDREPVFRIEF